MNALLKGIKTAENKTVTENGALTHKSTLNSVLDLFFMGGAARNKTTEELNFLFQSAWQEDKNLTAKLAFYLRDIREGVGERKVFRDFLVEWAQTSPETLLSLLKYVPEYGRWDDLWVLLRFKNFHEEIRKLLEFALDKSAKNLNLLLVYKWLPSENASSKQTKSYARILMKILGKEPKEYRKMLTEGRAKLELVERFMSQKSWKLINYQSLPSKSAMIYRKAFSRNDAERYVAYLEKVKKGEKKINASTLFPYELYNQVKIGKYDETVEQQWKALPNYAGDNNALVMADVSMSMNGLPMSVSVSLALYFAERNKGAFAGHFMTFSESPELVKVVGKNLKDKMNNIEKAKWQMNTNLQAAFDLILSTALANSVPPEDMPSSLVIVSDMEFDQATNKNKKTNFDKIKEKYLASGYVMPQVIFWNVNSRSKQVPVTKDEEGTILVSGCSPVIFKQALTASAQTPIEYMREILESPRYSAISV